MSTKPIIANEFDCAYCGAALRRGDQNNLNHAVQHFPAESLLPWLHRELEKRGYDELEAHALTDWAAGVILATPAQR